MYQSLTIIGNLGKDPELRYTPSGNAVTSFPLATNQRWTDREGEPQQSTTWFRVTAWNRLAETCSEFLTKGRLVLVVGTLQADPETGGPKTWVGRDGSTRASYEVRAITVKFMSGTDATREKPESAAERHGAAERQRPENDGDIPF